MQTEMQSQRALNPIAPRTANLYGVLAVLSAIELIPKQPITFIRWSGNDTLSRLCLTTMCFPELVGSRFP